MPAMSLSNPVRDDCLWAHRGDNWLSAGSHTFDFHFNLPPRLPSTFSSKTGHISYFIQASCMGREHILAKKRTYLLIQGTSDFHPDQSFQVPRGRWGGGERGPRELPGCQQLPSPEDSQKVATNQARN
ncbi:Hypothetical predicted protein [Marmota monax]|uniref:Arrestin-like N-terminal domain-containing protein n=1 Tax=Marmota monax TaxID=9995 RepID=A0A5E4DB08_MARMO|nr:Hypothetical predicted protein [Marmota monax]